MPLSGNEDTNSRAAALNHQFHEVFGKHPGYRPTHAKGHLLTGTFTPTSRAATLSSAPHFSQPSTPITVRFSNSIGLPKISDTDARANPQGFAVRFHLGSRVHKDIITHSTPYFPVRTGAHFLELLKAQVATRDAGAQGDSPSPIEKFLDAHPETLKFIQARKPSPVSLATEPYFGINAYKLITSGRAVSYIRYRIVPVGGSHFLSEEDLKAKSESYLFDELPADLEKGPFNFKLLAQIAAKDDVTDDATVQWPEDREIAELGTIKLDKVLSDEESKTEQKYIIFDPMPRVQGIEPSDDPLIDSRAALYLISGRERRQEEYKE